MNQKVKNAKVKILFTVICLISFFPLNAMNNPVNAMNNRAKFWCQKKIEEGFWGKQIWQFFKFRNLDDCIAFYNNQPPGYMEKTFKH